MVRFMITFCIFTVCLGVARPETSPSPSPSPSVTDVCSSIIPDMAGCLPFVSKGSKDKKPTASCCSGLKTVLKTDPKCICEALKSDNVDLERVTSLPSACKVSAPPISKCGVSSSPGAAPGVGKPHTSPSPSPSPAPTPSSAPSPSDVCSSIIYDMADCISFISKGSTDKNPTTSCCSGFKTVLNTDAECICEALKSSAQMGIDVDLKRAAALPSACQVSAPPIDKCGISASPGAAPGAAPGTAPAANPLPSPSNGAPSPNSEVAPAIPGSPNPPAEAPASDAGEGSKQAPAPAQSSGTYKSACFSVPIISIIIGVVSFSYISV